MASTSKQFTQQNMFGFHGFEAHEKAAMKLQALKNRGLNIDSEVLRIKKYFQKVMVRQSRKNFIKFPSLKALVSYFNVGKDDVYMALNELRQTGFDYEIIDKNRPILVWDTLAIKSYK